MAKLQDAKGNGAGSRKKKPLAIRVKVVLLESECPGLESHSGAS